MKEVDNLEDKQANTNKEKSLFIMNKNKGACYANFLLFSSNKTKVRKR